MFPAINQACLIIALLSTVVATVPVSANDSTPLHAQGRTPAHALCPAIRTLSAIRADVLAAEAEFAEDLAAVHSSFLPSATNLVHYVALRRHDLRPLQQELHDLGLSSLGAAEAHVLSSLDAVLSIGHSVAGRCDCPTNLTSSGVAVSFAEGRSLLQQHSLDTLGAAPLHHDTRIMVTMPSEAASTPTVAAELVAGGMTIARLNCAHDGPDEWAAMVREGGDEGGVCRQSRCIELE